ncbi:hypothetical protein G3I40_07425 [Streptomyces sp. SID14478]|uniref:hypothetical protein n=1 Tax=Streptomyces sp. SID14478 TaxID=2706073 RepID=UPI0013DD75F2|nr:hypothetical protein [Streptomyces sp. SID14478]NEB75062.1 hypothetical protein [Streptomyces sp. SID14478]
MSGDKQHPGTGGSQDPQTLPTVEDLGSPQELTSGQVAVTNVAQAMNNVMHGMFGGKPGRAYQYGAKASDYEDQDLNTMLDLLEGTKPSHLEEAGHALWRASKAINDAAEELRQNITHASEDWKGQSGTSFETWGKGLAGTTEQLASYAELAGVQVSAAAGGLASVKSSMPKERDTRSPFERKKPEAFAMPAQTDSNPKYTEAKRVEKDRQEAINQINRLASFYSVSAQGLNQLQQSEPTFEAMPNVGVPQPSRQRVGGATGDGTGSEVSPAGHASAISAQPHSPVVDHVSHHASTPEAKDVPASITYPDRSVGTEIDSVGTLPPPTSETPVSSPPLATGPSNGPTNTPAPFATGYTNPMTSRAMPTAYGTGGGKTSTPAQMRTPTSGGTSSTSRGTTNSPMGRATSSGQASGRPGGAPGRGITGGTARPTSSAAGRGSGSGAGANRNGVVGGKPSTTTGNVGKNGSRVPRGTVVGGEPSANARSGAGRIGQRGVLGAPNAETTGAKSSAGGRRVQGASEAVTGRPAARNAAGRAGRGGFSAGGSGLVRGPQGQQNRSEDDEAEASQRPDYLVEDPETHLPGNQRRDVPPVIN